MNKTRKISIISLSAVFAVMLIMAICIIFVQQKVDIVARAEMQACLLYDEELKNSTCIPTLAEDFDDDEITIILNAEHSGIKLKNSEYDFDYVVNQLEKVENIDVDSITELFKIEENESVSNTKY